MKKLILMLFVLTALTTYAQRTIYNYHLAKLIIEKCDADVIVSNEATDRASWIIITQVPSYIDYEYVKIYTKDICNDFSDVVQIINWTWVNDGEYYYKVVTAAKEELFIMYTPSSKQLSFSCLYY